MAVPNFEPANSGPLSPLPKPAGNRPIALGAGGPVGGPKANTAGPQGNAQPNRPIPLQAGPSDDVPEGVDIDEEEDDDLREVLRNAPAWLISTVFHMALLILLGLLAATQLTPAQSDVQVAYAEPDYAEQLGSQLVDPTVLQGDSTQLENTGPEQIITPRDLPPVDDPLAAPPDLGDLKMLPVGVSGLTPATSNVKNAPMVGWALSGRRAGSKRVLLGKYGGDQTTEHAVEMGLEWLVKQQKADGTWSLSGPYPDGSQSENIPAATAMALLAFQGHGDTHRDGKYSKNVAKGWSALLKMQRKDGLFSGTMTEPNSMLYTHAQCAIAVCELYGMTQDSFYRPPAERAINYAVAAQSKEQGGWRYKPGEDTDTSVTGWFVMALQSARMAKLTVPEETLTRISGYLDTAQSENGQQYGYWQRAQVSNAMNAEGLLCREYLGWRQDDPRLVAGVSALNQAPVAYDGGMNQDVYYWYYATQATHHMEGKIWDDWNKVMKQEVPAHQIKAGPETGSWNPRGDKWGMYGGRLYVTCLSIYMLEVYYRHMPIYSGYKFVAGVEPPAGAAGQKAPTSDDKPSETTGEKSPPDAPPAESPAKAKKASPAAAANASPRAADKDPAK